MAGYQRLALAFAWPVLLAGCQMIPQGWHPDQAATATAKSDVGKPAAGKPAGAEATATASSNEAAEATATASSDLPQTVQQHEIQTTLDQLQSHGKLTPQARRQLEADLAQSDPDSISRILRMLKSSLSTAADAAPVAGLAAAARPLASPEPPSGPAKPQDFEAARREAVAKAAALIESISEVPPSSAGSRPVPAVTVSTHASAVRRLPPAPQEVFQAYETLLAAKYPHTDPAEHAEPALLAALATQLAANAKPISSAAATPAAAGREDWRDEAAMLASFVGESQTTPPGAQPPAAPDKSSPTSPVAAPLATPAAAPPAELPGTWRDALTQFIERLEEQKDRPAGTTDELRQQVYLRLLYVMAGRREEALEPISGLSLPEQEFWNKLVYGLSTYLDENRIPNRERRAGEAKLYFADATTRLGEVSTLAVSNAAFCTAVRSYGVIERFPQDEFLPGAEVLLYAELDNFVAERQPGGYRTEFRASYLIFDRLGQPVETEPHELPVITETCNNLRHDFFISYRVRLPERMNPGEHQLKLTIHDTVGQKIGTTEVKFKVAGPN